MAYKSYDSLSDYEAADRNTSESEVSYIASDAVQVIVDGVNVEVGAAAVKKGDMVFVDGDGAVRFIALDTLQSIPDGWTAVGVVAKRKGGKAYILWRDPLAYEQSSSGTSSTSYQWTKYACYILSDYTLDGEEHEVTWTIRDDSGTGNSLTMTYSATTDEEFAAAVDEWIKEQEDEGLSVDCECYVHPDTGEVWFQYDSLNAYQELADSASGITMTCLMNQVYDSTYQWRLPQRNGNLASTRYLINYEKALEYLSDDLSGSTYNPTSEVTSVKTANPVCLPAYLGESEYNDDMCALLRETFGEGEDGWKAYMKTLLPADGMPLLAAKAPYCDGHYMTYLWRDVYCYVNGEKTVVNPAVEYCASVDAGVDGLGAGDWYVPSIAESYELFGDITYGMSGVTRAEADPINRSLYAIGGSYYSCNGGRRTSTANGTTSMVHLNQCSMDTGTLNQSFITTPIALYDLGVE